jgi:hypothetical protein
MTINSCVCFCLAGVVGFFLSDILPLWVGYSGSGLRAGCGKFALPALGPYLQSQYGIIQDVLPERLYCTVRENVLQRTVKPFNGC